ncbi:MAG: DUF928 domain-containing protein [Cyanobacteria bacterium SBC]|nr:DUF928 domain-containing protein [Cyanobacteria bacterium SBC]
MKPVTFAITSAATLSALFGTLGCISAGAVTFVAPSDEAPRTTTGGASRGSVGFQAPSSESPRQTTGGASRGNVDFQAPDAESPRQTTGGASRGNVDFQAPDAESPRQTTGGASRGEVEFTSPDTESPQQTTGGASRGEVEFASPDTESPQQTEGGAARGDVEFASPSSESPQQTEGGASRRSVPFMKPLIPPSNYGRTIASHPSFFVYVPEAGVTQAFLSVQTETGNLHYQSFVSVSGHQGVMRFSLPEDAPALEIGRDYQWHVVLLPNGILRPDSPRVSGWVERVEDDGLAVSGDLSLQLADTYGRNGLWYDALTTIADLWEAQPHDDTMAVEWHDFLAQGGLEEISTQPLVD